MTALRAARPAVRPPPTSATLLNTGRDLSTLAPVVILPMRPSGSLPVRTWCSVNHMLPVDTFRRQLDETRELLGDHLSLYQIHSATVESGVLGDAAVLSALAELRSGGVSVGLTTTGPQQAQTVARALAVGGFDTVQATWSLLEPSAGPALADAHREGLGVIVKEVLANGRLTSRGGCAELDELAGRLDASPDAVALAAVLAQPWADVVLSGAGTAEQIMSNLAAREVRWDAEAAEAVVGLAEEPESYWRRRSELEWTRTGELRRGLRRSRLREE
jgi:aryl-alcohol dehydrogenase-like predicted oxidoreductase